MSSKFLQPDPTRPAPTFLPAPPGFLACPTSPDSGLAPSAMWVPVVALRVSLFWSAEDTLWSQRVSYITPTGEEADYVLFPDGRLLDIYTQTTGDTVVWASLAEYEAADGFWPPTEGEKLL